MFSLKSSILVLCVALASTASAIPQGSPTAEVLPTNSPTAVTISTKSPSGSPTVIPSTAAATAVTTAIVTSPSAGGDSLTVHTIYVVDGTTIVSPTAVTGATVTYTADSTPTAITSGGYESRIHLGPGPIVGIVVGTVMIVALSIFLCCPCWKAGPGRVGGRKQRQVSEVDGSSQVYKVDSNETKWSDEGLGKEAPPNYDELEKRERVPELSS